GDSKPRDVASLSYDSPLTLIGDRFTPSSPSYLTTGSPAQKWSFNSSFISCCFRLSHLPLLRFHCGRVGTASGICRLRYYGRRVWRIGGFRKFRGFPIAGLKNIFGDS